jgi:rRNA maturation endonuclease Nob1
MKKIEQDEEINEVKKMEKLKCTVCGTRFHPPSWRREDVRKGFCPDCGAKARPL